MTNGFGLSNMKALRACNGGQTKRTPKNNRDNRSQAPDLPGVGAMVGAGVGAAVGAGVGAATSDAQEETQQSQTESLPSRKCLRMRSGCGVPRCAWKVNPLAICLHIVQAGKNVPTYFEKDCRISDDSHVREQIMTERNPGRAVR